jgi:multidrug efflux system membrane fusion protein
MEQQPPASLLLAESPPSRTAPATGHTPPPRKKRRWIWILLLAVFALAFYLVWRHKPAASAQAPPGRRQQGAVTINAATAGSGPMAINLDAIGTVTPTYTATINSQVSGQVVSVHYREGQTVAKGTPLLDINPAPYQAALDTAQGTLAKDRGVLAQATMDLDRYRTAWSKNAIAKQQLDDQEKLVVEDQGQVKADEGAVETDRVQLGFCHIVSPISGRVGLRLVDPGNIVAANSTTALVVVTQVQPITVVFTISEDNLPQVEAAIKHQRGGLKVTVFDRTNEHQLAIGKLLSLDNQIDTTTGTLKLRAIFENKDMALYPNQFVNTRLLTNVLQDQIMVPNSAVQRNGTQAFVYRIDDIKQGAKGQTTGVAELVNVKVGNTDGMMTAVEGINAGDQIANSSFEKLQNKSQVRIVKQPLGSSDSEESGTP